MSAMKRPTSQRPGARASTPPPASATRLRAAAPKGVGQERGAPAAHQELAALVAALAPVLAAHEASATTVDGLAAVVGLRHVLGLVQRYAADPDGHTLTLTGSRLFAGHEGEACGLVLTRG